MGALPQQIIDAQARLEQRRLQEGIGRGGLHPIGPLPTTRPPETKPGPQAVRKPEPEIDFSAALYERIEPGQYKAISGRSRVYWDRRFMRHTCMIEFSVLSELGSAVIAKLPLFLNLGKDKERPRAGRCSLFWQTWVSANGGRQPVRGDRMTPAIFKRRAALVEVADTKHATRAKLSDGKISYDLIPVEQPYSIIRRVISWDTEGVNSHQSTSQGRHGVNGQEIRSL